METDLAAEIVSYLDITEFFPCDRKEFLSAFCDLPGEVENEWMKASSASCTDTRYEKIWRVNNKIHREGGPAIEYATGTKNWLCCGVPHREDGPAAECQLRNMWRIDGIYHKDLTQVASVWYFRGKIHRIDGPAVIYPDMTEEWWLDDKLHRDDGPAEIRDDGTCVWRLYGIIHRDGGPAVEYSDGSSEWWSVGSLHRLDGPALIHGDVQEWYRNGQLHRENGPAIVMPGVEVWYRKGVLHRMGGPAVVTADSKEWWISGKLVYRQGTLIPRSTVQGNVSRFTFLKNSEARVNHKRMMGLLWLF